MLLAGFHLKCLLILILSFVYPLLSVPDVIQIGGIFEIGDEILEMAFKSAVDRINSDKKILPRTKLVAQVERIEKSDSFQASKKSCTLIERGVAAIFGPQSVESSTHIQSICATLNIPHVEFRPELSPFPANQSVNLFPHANLFGAAIKDLIRNKKWRKFAIIYQENEGLLRLEEILRDEAFRHSTIIVRQFENGDYRIVLKELYQLKIKNLIVDVPREKIRQVLSNAISVNMLSEYHDYIFTSLDVQTIDLQDFRYIGANISSFSLIDKQSNDYKEIITFYNSNIPLTDNTWMENDLLVMEQHGIVSNFTTEVALMYDSVKQFAKALEGLINAKHITTAILSCDLEDKWQFGDSLANFMKIVKTNGITGDIKFHARSGLRTGLKLDILELEYEGFKLVGNWTLLDKVNYMSTYTEKKREDTKEVLKNKTLTITTILSKPYVMLVSEWKERNLTGKEMYEGFCIDLIELLAQTHNFTYVIKLVEDKVRGEQDEKGEWNGMIRELVDGKADIAVADLTVTRDRETAVDFTMPFMNLGIGILFKKPTKEPPWLFSFMSPLAIEVWIYLVTAFLGVSLCLFVVARFSPYEWINPHPCIKHPEELENNFTMKNTLWFTIGCLMQQGCDIMPRALSTRVLAASWWFFILILVSSYTANLAAFLTVERMVNPIESAEDLAKQTKIHYGCLASGSTRDFFRNSTMPTHARMWTFMESARPSVFVDSNEKGVERVKRGSYAFLMESTSIEYIVERECDLYQVGAPLDSKSYGIATQPRSQYRDPISDTIVQLQEKGELNKLKEKWWSQKICEPKDGAQKSAGAASELGLSNVGGVFLVLAAGSTIAVLICVGEFFWKMKQIPREERDHIFVELMRELKHVICCYGSTRPIRRPGLDDFCARMMMSSPNGIPGVPIRSNYGGFAPHSEYIPANYGLGREMFEARSDNRGGGVGGGGPL